MEETIKNNNYEAQTIILKDSRGKELFCFLEQIVEVESKEYGLLTPVDTPVCLFKINSEEDFQEIIDIDEDDEIIKNADSVLQEHNLKLITSASTLTVSGDLDEPIYDELEEDYLEDDEEEFDHLVSFNVKDDKYEILIPIFPYFILGELRDEGAFLLEKEDEERIGPLVEAEYEKTLA
tara:strand:+ start:94 stop:630 length:537 start_codon:yes stop_codon:yes gene_type:complete